MSQNPAIVLPLDTRIPARGRLPERLGRLATRKPLGTFGAVVLTAMVLVALLANVIAPYDPLANDRLHPIAKPSADHWAGTDQFGRDVFSRVLFGARTALIIGVSATAIAMIPAVIIGIISAYFGGAVDYSIQRAVDAIQAIPSLILLIAIMVILGPSVRNMIIALSFGYAVTSSRIVRGAAIGIIGATYIDAARVIGASNVRLMVRHLLPNIVPPLIVTASLGFGQLILAEASVSFLGYGIRPPTPSWGNMVAADGRAYMFAQPWMLLAPTLALGLVVFGVNMFGDAVRDLIDPRLRGT
jgi:peptide/nickel transport system permease protein